MFKVDIEGSVVAKVTLNRNIIVRELIKELKGNYGLGNDIICMNIEGRRYDEDKLICRYRKN
jgi:hypothetical protein